jgi:hypothetical protein
MVGGGDRILHAHIVRPNLRGLRRLTVTRYQHDNRDDRQYGDDRGGNALLDIRHYIFQPF